MEAEFAPRAQVFPGGRIDDADADPAWRELVRLDALGDGPLIEGDPEPGHPTNLALIVGAIREVFEETCILVGVDPGDYPGREWAEASRQKVHRDDASFLGQIQSSGLKLSPAPIAYFARWITPKGMPRRYDTRFFAAPMPAGQEAVAAPGEVQSLEWITPAAALARADTNDAYTLPPTRAVLTTLSRYAGVDEAMGRLPEDANVAPIVPKIVSMPGGTGLDGIRVLMPGDPGYE